MTLTWLAPMDSPHAYSVRLICICLSCLMLGAVGANRFIHTCRMIWSTYYVSSLNAIRSPVILATTPSYCQMGGHRAAISDQGYSAVLSQNWTMNCISDYTSNICLHLFKWPHKFYQLWEKIIGLVLINTWPLYKITYRYTEDSWLDSWKREHT